MCNTTENAFCITFSLRCFSIDWPCLWCNFILAQPMDLSIKYSISIFHLNLYNPSYFLVSEFKSRIRFNKPIQNMNFFQKKEILQKCFFFHLIQLYRIIYASHNLFKWTNSFDIKQCFQKSSKSGYESHLCWHKYFKNDERIPVEYL